MDSTTISYFIVGLIVRFIGELIVVLIVGLVVKFIASFIVWLIKVFHGAIIVSNFVMCAKDSPPPCLPWPGSHI